MAQNEMAAKPALPERIRSMEGLPWLRDAKNQARDESESARKIQAVQPAVPRRHRCRMDSAQEFIVLRDGFDDLR